MFERTKHNLLKARYHLTRLSLGALFFLKKIYTLQVVALLIVGGTLLVTFTMYAAPNAMFMYQGRLIATSNDVPVSNGNYYFKLKIYNSALGGNANCVWATGSVTDSTGSITNNCAEALSTSTIQVVVNRGTFVIPMGDIGITGGKMPDISNLDFKQNTYYLGVAVCGTGADAATACAQNPAEMTPLLSLSSQAGQALSVMRSLQANTFNQVPSIYATVQDNPLSNSATTITVAANATAPYPANGTLLIDNEAMTYTDKTSSQFTGVVRARLGTSAATHNQGATVKTYLFSGAPSAATLPVFHITSDGTTFINSNIFPVPSQLGFQTDGTIHYALGNDRLGNNYFNIRAGSLDDFSVPTLLNIRIDSSPTGSFSLHNINGRSATLTANDGSNTYSAVTITPGIITVAGMGIDALDTLRINRPTLAGTQTITDASSFTVNGSPLRSSGTVGTSYGVNITAAIVTSGIAQLTNAYGLAVTAPSSPTNNYTAIFTGGNVGVGTASPITQLHVPGRVPTALLSSTSTGNNATAIGVVVQGRYAYLINYATDTLRIYDVSDPAAPVAVNGAGTTTGDGPQAIYAQGHYVYIINNVSPRSLQIFDVSNPAAPTSIGTAPLTAVSYSINVKGRYVYIATTSTGTSNTNSLQIFDAGDPKNPLLISTTAVGTDPYGIDVQGRYAYISNSATSNFYIVDISNPTTPAIVATSNAVGFGQHKVVVQGRYAYFTTSQNRTLSIIDVSNPSSPALVGSVGTGDIVEGLAVQGRYAYVTRDYASGSPQFQIYNISNPASPALVGSLAMDGGAQSVFVQGRYAYTATVITNNLEIFDLGGGYIQQLEVGGLEMANGSVRSNFTVNNNLDVRSGATIGIGGMYSAGPMTINGLELAGLDSMFGVRNTSGTPLFKIANDGFVMLGFELTSGNNLSFASGAARTIGIEAAISAGQNLTFLAGGAGSGNNLAGGDVVPSSGWSRGSGTSKVIIQTPQNQTSSDSTANAAASMFEFANGHIASLALSSAPSISGCGSGGAGSSIVSGSNDIAGRVILGSGLAADGCTITFARSYTTAPLCTVQYHGAISNMNAYLRAISTSSATVKFTPTPSGGGASKTEPGNTATSINSISNVSSTGTYNLTLNITGMNAPYNFQYRWGGVDSQQYSGYPSNTQISINGGAQGTLTFTTSNTPPAFGPTPVTLTDLVTVSNQDSFSYFCVANGEQ